jgi:hypothetical protein
MAGVVNLSPGRPHDLRATMVQGKPKEKPCSFPRVKTTDSIAFALAVNNTTGKTTNRTAQASIPSRGNVQFSVDTSGERIHVAVFTPNP